MMQPKGGASEDGGDIRNLSCSGQQELACLGSGLGAESFGNVNSSSSISI